MGEPTLSEAARTLSGMLDLILPLVCGGCGLPATRWCGPCGRSLAVRADEPHLITPRVDPGVPVFSLGRYTGSRRRAVLAVKEHGRTDLIGPLAVAVHDGLERLLAWGMVGAPLILIPAPTRTVAARRRGGDPVARIARAATAGMSTVTVVAALRTRALARDSVGLSGAERQRNIAGRVRVARRALGPAPEVLLVDDIVTTGATAAESVRALRGAGARVAGVLTVAHA